MLAYVLGVAVMSHSHDDGISIADFRLVQQLLVHGISRQMPECYTGQQAFPGWPVLQRKHCTLQPLYSNLTVLLLCMMYTPMGLQKKALDRCLNLSRLCTQLSKQPSSYVPSLQRLRYLSAAHLSGIALKAFQWLHHQRW